VRKTGEIGSEVGGEEVAVRGGGEMVGGGFVIVCMAEGVAMAVSEVRRRLGKGLLVVVM